MRRCCFDLEVKDSEWGPFFCAVVYDEASDSFHEFLDARETCRFLAGSDTLITFNGPRFDMIILERDAGQITFDPLRTIPHLDVRAMLWPHTTLAGTVHYYVPQIETRLNAYIIERWEWGVWNRREKWKMTQARCDVERTYACLAAVENDPDLPARIRAGFP
jgi:hypothetical protein